MSINENKVQEYLSHMKNIKNDDYLVENISLLGDKAIEDGFLDEFKEAESKLYA